MNPQQLVRMLEIFLVDNGKQARQTFTRALQTFKVKVLSAGDMHRPCQFLYKVPPTLCRQYQLPNNQSIELLSASAALAIMDDLSAYGVMAADKKLRPGVSLSLTTDILQVIKPGQEVICNFQTNKIGKYMGFQTMELLDPVSKQPLARGKHIKFMPMGFAWETAISHATISRFVAGHDKLHDQSIIKKAALSLIGHNKPPHDIVDSNSTEIGALFRGLGVEKASNNNSSHNHNHHSTEEHMVKLKPGLNMILGHMHGGAAAMSVEQAASTSSAVVNKQLFLHSMQLTYLTGLRGSLRISCSPSPGMMPGFVGVEGGIYTAMSDSKSAPLVQFQSSWTSINDFITSR